MTYFGGVMMVSLRGCSSLAYCHPSVTFIASFAAFLMAMTPKTEYVEDISTGIV